MRPSCPERSLAPRDSGGAISFLGAASLTAIVAVLIFVSLPRLRGFVCIENESEAREIARVLAEALSAHPRDEDIPALEDLLREGESSAVVGDEELLAGGRILRRHGYLFAVVPVGTPPPYPDPKRPGEVLAAETQVPSRPTRFAVRAWPWKRGRTGRAAFLALPDGRLWTLEGRTNCPEGLGAELSAPTDWALWRPSP